MLEQTVHGVLLAIHNMALVGCAAAPFYNRNLVDSFLHCAPGAKNYAMFAYI
jgi:hypothetical protein